MADIDGFIMAGYYDTAVGKVAHHTYARADVGWASQLYFHCYGGIEGPNPVFPAELYNINGQSLRIHQADFKSFVARGIAEFCIPTDLTRTHYDRKTGGCTGLGDNSGIVYGVTGVCHQMCNRILVSTGHRENSAINWPPDFAASSFVYGLRGRFESRLYDLVDLLEKKPNAKEEVKELLDSYFEDLKQLYTSEVDPANSLHLSHIQNLNGAQTREEVIGHILETARLPLQQKHELDNLLLRGQVSPNEYAEKVNQAMNTLFIELGNRLDGATYESIFHELPSDRSIQIIHVEDIPPSYEELRKRLGL